jgi:hypothetical protein
MLIHHVDFMYVCKDDFYLTISQLQRSIAGIVGVCRASRFNHGNLYRARSGLVPNAVRDPSVCFGCLATSLAMTIHIAGFGIRLLFRL